MNDDALAPGSGLLHDHGRQRRLRPTPTTGAGGGDGQIRRHRKCEVLRVAERHGHSIGGIRLRRFGELEAAGHDKLHLQLLGSARTRHGLLDLLRGVLGDCQRRPGEDGQRDPARMAQNQSAPRIAMLEDALHGGAGRGVLPDKLREPVEEHRQSLGKRAAFVQDNDPVVDRHRTPCDQLDDAPAAQPGSRIDADDPHRAHGPHPGREGAEPRQQGVGEHGRKMWVRVAHAVRRIQAGRPAPVDPRGHRSAGCAARAAPPGLLRRNVGGLEMPRRRRIDGLTGPLLLGCALVAAGCGGPAAPTVTMTRVGPEAPAPVPVLHPDLGTARAFRAQSSAELLRGEAAAGEPGDFVLRNDRLTAVVRAAGHRGRVAPTGGHLIDLAPAGAQDAFGEATLFLDANGQVMPIFTEVAVARDGQDGGMAIVRAAGHDARDEQVGVEVDYILESGADRLRMMTTVTHRGRSHYRDFVVGHWMSWGGLHPFTPGPGGELEGQRTRSGWVGADSAGTAILLAGVGLLLEAVHGRDFSQVIEQRTYLTPGSTLSVETFLFVAPAGGVAAAETMLNGLRHAVTGQVRGMLREKLRQRPVRDGWVMVAARDGSWVTRARTDSNGQYVLDVEPGHYRLVAVANGRPPSRPIEVRVDADGLVEQMLLIDPPGRMRITVTAAGALLPARVALTGRRGTQTPVLGPPSSLPLAGNFIYARGGKFTGRVSPGEYDVTVGAGPEYGQVTRTVTVRTGETARLAVELPRQMNTDGHVALDPRVHTVHGPTSPVTGSDRLGSCAVEGIDALIATDERAGEPWTLGDTAGLLAMRGLELQVPGARLGAMPLVTVPVLPDRLPGTPGEAMPFLRGLPGSPLVAVFRPRAPSVGYFETFAFDAAAQTLPRGGFTLDFDLLEILGPGLGADTDQAVRDYLALVGRGRFVTPFGASGSDDVARQICGVPRTWLRADVHDAAAVEAALRRGAAVASGGPLIIVDPPTGGGREVHLRVAAPAWARPSTLDLYVDTGPFQHIEFGVGDGPLNDARTITVPVGTTWVVAVVDGPRRPNPLYPGGVRPLAVTAPVRIIKDTATSPP